MTACAGRIGFGKFKALPSGIVFPVYGNQGGHAKASFVLFSHFGSRGFGSHHDNSEVFSDLHALFNNIKAVGIGKAGILFHQRHDRFNDIGVLFVRGQVDDQICRRQHLFIGTHGKAVLRGIFPGLPFPGNGGFP